MKRLIFAAAICTVVIACTREKDTGSGEVWLRPVEPRLTGATGWQPCTKPPRPGHAVREARCGDALHIPAAGVSMAPEACDAMTANHTQTIHTLAAEPSCTDAAISALQRFARTDPRAISDLSAAFYLRAQREDRPSDLLQALETAEHAVGAARLSREARFNLALIEQALGLPDEAIASWDAFLRIDPSPWRSEALANRDSLRKANARRATIQWPRNREQLRTADRSTIAQLIARFPYATQRFIEEELLPQWAENPTPAALDRARLIASELSQLTGDPYVLDVVNAITPSSEASLRVGHLALRDARAAERALDRLKAAADYQNATHALGTGGSPLRLGAELGFVSNLLWFDKTRLPEVPTLLDSIEREARSRGYVHLLGRVHHTRGYYLYIQSRFVEAIAQYDAAIPLFRQVSDYETIASLHVRKMGMLEVLGQPELAWREAIEAQRYASHLLEPGNLNILAGTMARTAVALGHPRIALRYQAARINAFRESLAEAPPNSDRSAELHGHLAIALREGAGIELRNGHHDLARQLLREAMFHASKTAPESPSTQLALLARAEEVRAQTLLHDPNQAIAAFTQAIKLSAESKEYRTFRANLFVQRAEAHRRAANSAAAESDLRQALAELRAEESEILQHRQRGKGEDLWSSYFGRFQDTYRLLIRQLVEEGKAAEAFAYAEKARAFEPLNLVLQLAVVPPAFQRLVQPDGTLALTDIQANLPRDTFLISYCVLDDRTYAWIVTQDRVEVVTQPVRRQDIERWTADLQRAARRSHGSAFELGLVAPYARLLATPLAAIAKMPGGQDPSRRLVFIPDAAIHGLPLVALRNPANRRYLIQDSAIEIAGSATLYVFSLLRDAALASSPRPPSALLIGNPKFDEGLSLTRGMKLLPRARREVDRIRPLYAPRATVLVDRDATAEAILTRAGSNTIVHFAGHAIANGDAPSRSLLLLAPTEKHSGALDAVELLTRVQLNETRLVVLSACSSAGGSPVGPEGLAPLVRPMLAAGAPAVIGSLWDVEDADAENLLVAFHRHYRAGGDVASALRAAQLDSLNNNKSVLAWAPFQAIGHASSPFAPAEAQRRNNP